jgi:hypothetical protein
VLIVAFMVQLFDGYVVCWFLVQLFEFSTICNFAGLSQTNTVLVLVQISLQSCGMLSCINHWYNYYCVFVTVAKFSGIITS